MSLGTHIERLPAHYTQLTRTKASDTFSVTSPLAQEVSYYNLETFLLVSLDVGVCSCLLMWSETVSHMSITFFQFHIGNRVLTF